MPLRYNKILKLFAILIFSFELLAPVLLMAKSKQTTNDSPATLSCNITEQAKPADLLSQLLFEEVGSEEREGKDGCLLSVCFVEVYNQLQKFQPIQVTWFLPKDKFDTQPSLFTLHRVLLI